MSNVIVLVLTLAGVALAQQMPRRHDFDQSVRAKLAVPPPERPRLLTKDKEVIFPVPPFTFFGSAKCDTRSNLFFHVDSGSFNRAVVLKLSMKDKEGRAYVLPEQDEEKTAFNTFAASPSGTLYMLIDSDNGPFVVPFNDDGKAQKHVKLALPKGLRIQTIVPFDDGTIAVSGIFGKKAERTQQGKRYAALFNSQGELVKEFSKLGETRLDDSQALFDGASTVGDDGMVYLLIGDHVVVATPTGEVVRRLTITNPDPDSTPRGVKVSSNVLAITMKQVVEKNQVRVSFLLLNATTGDRISYLEPDPILGDVPVCFTRKDGFTFYRPSNGQLKLFTASIE
jgi:hypothetical protein